MLVKPLAIELLTLVAYVEHFVNSIANICISHNRAHHGRSAIAQAVPTAIWRFCTGVRFCKLFFIFILNYLLPSIIIVVEPS